MGRSLLPSDIDKWYSLPESPIEVGFKFMGEFRMGAEWGKVLIQNSSQEYINFGDIGFAFCDFDKPFLITEDSQYILLNWMFYHVHSHIVPAVFNLNNRTFCLVEPKRILWPIEIYNSDERVFVKCNETVWENSKMQRGSAQVELGNMFKPLDSFFKLDPSKVGVKIYRWEGKKLIISEE